MRIGIFSTGYFGLLVDGTVAAAAVLYILGLRACRGADFRFPKGRVLAFALGLLVVVTAVSSELATQSSQYPTPLVLQHVLLMMVGPPLLIAGQPLRVLRHTEHQAPRSSDRDSRSIAIVIGPLSWLLYYLSMGVFFLTPLSRQSAADAVLHDACNVWFLAVGGWFWSGILGQGRWARRRSHVRKVLAVGAGMPLETVVGVALVLKTRPLLPAGTIVATHAAGQVLWMASMLASGVATAVLFHQWIMADNQRTALLDAQFEADLLRPDH